MKQITITLYTDSDDNLVLIENDLLNTLKLGKYTFDVGDIEFGYVKD